MPSPHYAVQCQQVFNILYKPGVLILLCSLTIRILVFYSSYTKHVLSYGLGTKCRISLNKSCLLCSNIRAELENSNPISVYRKDGNYDT